MPVQRKVFRIEQMGSPPLAPSLSPTSAGPGTGGSSALQQQEILTELKALRDLIEQRTAVTTAPELDAGQFDARGLRQLKDETDQIRRAINRTKQEIATLHFGAFDGEGQARATRELDAVVDGTESATQQILEAAEIIEEAANSLSASVKSEQDRALAQDIRDHVIRIFEACNFQDISSQRIAKVLATLKFIEERIAHMMDIWGGSDALKDYAPAIGEAEQQLLNGPRLGDDHGHASQDDIDKMFARG